MKKKILKTSGIALAVILLSALTAFGLLQFVKKENVEKPEMYWGYPGTTRKIKNLQSQQQKNSVNLRSFPVSMTLRVRQ